MGIKVVYAEGVDEIRPQVFCDFCGQRIVNSDRAAYAWKYREGQREFPVFFFHLAPVSGCLDYFEAKYHLRRMQWGHLRDFGPYLANNLDVV